MTETRHSAWPAPFRATSGPSAATGLREPTTICDKADMILLIGANIADNHPILCQHVEANPNKTLIVADPRVTKTAMMADLYLPLKPRSDIALINGMIHILIRTRPDQSRIHRAAHHRIRRAREVRWALHAGLCFANHRTERRADLQDCIALRPAKAAFIGWTMGVNHSTQGTETVNAINNLALITGNIGRAGASPFSITGQCNAMGTREAGFASSLPGYRKFESAKTARNWPRSGMSPPTAFRTTRGLAYPDIVEAAVSQENSRAVDHRD